ncbi:MAG: hypothetical protein KGL57_00150 [Burkholderiales bacterium]|nr:hypothetical protein [Burkholderiales bacterium]
MNKQCVNWALVCLLSGAALAAQAGSVAVVGTGSSASKLTPEQAAAIFLMRMKSLPGAGQAQLVVVASSKSELLSVIGKTDDQASAIWARQVFTGGGVPPVEVSTAAEAKKVLANPNAMALIDASEVAPATMKVLCSF